MYNINDKKNIDDIINILNELYPEAMCSLAHVNPMQLLVSTQLSAQCTDKRVNLVAKTLYKKYKTFEDFAKAEITELENDIRSIGIFRNKARNIKACCFMILTDYNGIIPNKLEDMLKLKGVGRKTANLILGDLYNILGIVVDTHVKRVTYRIGLTKNIIPIKVEFDLMDTVPKEKWNSFCHQIVYHGRAICMARKPNCINCKLKNFCEYGRDI